VENRLRTVYGRHVVVETALEFLILGPLEVRSEDGALDVGSSKQRALLGALLLHANETVSTTRLVDAIWGERPPATAEKLVQGYVHALRKRLGDGVLETRAPGYRLNVADGSLDLVEFERLVEEARSAPVPQAVELRQHALALWRGSALADVAIEGVDRNVVSRLNDLRLAAQIDQIDAELALGRHAGVIGELEALSAANPYLERLAAQLMLALYRSGRQAEALEFYRGLRRRLDEELGLQPGQELRDLEAAILRQDEELAAPVLVAPERRELAEPAPVELQDARTVSRVRRRRVLVAAAVAILVLALAVAALLVRGDPAPVVVAPNSLAVIDVDSNRVVDIVPVGIRPGSVAAGGGAIWAANLDERSLSRIDPVTRERVANIPLPATPDAVTYGAGAVWVVNGRLGMLYRIDPSVDDVTDAVRLGDRSITYANAGADFAAGSVWAAFGDSTLARADPAPPRADGVGSTDNGPAAVVVAFDSVWVANAGEATVQRFNPLTFEEGPAGELAVGSRPSGLAAGAGTIWVTSTAGDYVARLAVTTLAFDSGPPIPVEDGPTDVVFAEGSAWVTNAAAGSVSRIDPEKDEVVETIPIGNPLGGMAVSDGFAWVSVQAP
jgi:DNA-binding SARP family transcriptional activator